MSIFCTLSSLMNIFAFGNALHRLSTSVSSFDKGVSYMHIVSRFFSDFRSSASFIWLSCKSISTIFLQLFKKGLAYKKEMAVNWCTSCKCVLANEEVVNGVCERCGSEVIRKNQKEQNTVDSPYNQIRRKTYKRPRPCRLYSESQNSAEKLDRQVNGCRSRFRHNFGRYSYCLHNKTGYSFRRNIYGYFA